MYRPTESATPPGHPRWVPPCWVIPHGQPDMARACALSAVFTVPINRPLWAAPSTQLSTYAFHVVLSVVRCACAARWCASSRTEASAPGLGSPLPQSAPGLQPRPDRSAPGLRAVQPSDAMLDEMLRRCDRNADGYLSFNEFARNFLAQVPP